ncbi:MAG: hypothetical protein CMJ44_10050, partial [Pimelobacter sp.]|nr:hypothetical protein [Pimelobacter sp.]
MVVTLAEEAKACVIRLQIVNRERSAQDQSSAIWHDLAAAGITVRTVYLVAHLGVLDADLRAWIAEDSSNGVDARVANVAWLSDDLAATAVSDCMLVDDVTLVFSPPIAASDGFGLWTLSVAPEHVAAGREMLEQLWDEARALVDLPDSLDLEEP